MLNTFARNNLTIARESNDVEVRMRSQFNHTEYIIENSTISVICQDIAAISVGTTLLRKMREDKKELAETDGN